MTSEPTTEQIESVELPPTKMLPLGDIKPYWRNPRRIPEEAVAAVAESITRYGYQQPIVVDTDNVIVVGHTRHAALTQLGVDKAPVYVTDLPPDKAREYRLIDNRTSELTSWDHDALMLELREFEEGLLTSFFPEVSLEVDAINEAMEVTTADIEEASAKVLNVPATEAPLTTEVVCPACFHSFQIRTDTLPGLSKADMRVLKAVGDGGGDGQTG
jgi:ParB/Sulfiredoxin domain